MRQRRTDSQMLRRFVGGQVSALSEYEIDVTICTSTDEALDGDVWDMEGVDLSRFLAHPIVLWDHDMSQPIGRASNLKVTPEKITARVTFPDEGVSAKADEIRKMVKAGFVTGVSSGVVPTKTRQLDPRNPQAGDQVTQSILLEFSIVAVPSDASSGVNARSNGGTAVANPVTLTDDEAAAAATAADAAATAEIAAQRAAPRTRVKRKAIVFARGLYSVAQLCYMFESFGYQTACAKYEADIEGDGSQVPAMMVTMLHDLGDIILAMTAEEIAEALAGHDVEPELDDDDDDLTIDERKAIAAAKTPALRAYRRGLAHAKSRAGKKLSSASVRCLREAKSAHEEAIADTRSAIAKHKKAIGTIDDLIDGSADDEDNTDPENTSDSEAQAERSRRARALQLKANAHIRAA